MSDTATAERTASNVVTSETLADFHATKLGLETKPPEAKAEPVESANEESTDPPEGEQGDPPPKNAKLQQRFSELTAQRRSAEERAEREATRAAAAERERDELKAKLNPQPKADDEPPEPKPDDYENAFEYAKDLAEWTAQDVLRKRDKEEAEKAANKEREKIQRAWAGRVEKVKAEMPDYDETIAASDVAVSDPVRDAIIESDHGPRILYLLASEPAVAEKLSKLSVLGQLREIGKIEAKFEKEPEAKPEKGAFEKEPEPQRRPPAPIEPVRGGRVSENPVTAPGEFKGTFAEWKAARKAGKA